MTTRQRRWRRLAIRLAACAGVGAVVTVGVAWGIAAYSLRQTGRAFYLSQRQVPIQRWPAYVPSYFPPPSPVGVELRTTGVRLLTASAYELPKQLWAQRVEECGWPWYALQTSSYGSRNGDEREGSPWTGIGIPLYNNGRDAYATLGDKPLWPGFALDTAFYAAIAFTLWSAPGFIRRHRRRARGRCAACGYDLSGLPPGSPCPECAAKPPPTTPTISDRDPGAERDGGPTPAKTR